MAPIVDQFGRKRCQKKRKDVDYKLLQEFFQKKFVVHEQLAVEHSFSTYLCYAPDGLFWLNLYMLKNNNISISGTIFGQIPFRAKLLSMPLSSHLLQNLTQD